MDASNTAVQHEVMTSERGIEQVSGSRVMKGSGDRKSGVPVIQLSPVAVKLKHDRAVEDGVRLGHLKLNRTHWRLKMTHKRHERGWTVHDTAVYPKLHLACHPHLELAAAKDGVRLHGDCLGIAK